MQVLNLYNAIIKLLSGKTMSSPSVLYRSDYSRFWILMPWKTKVPIRCFLCGYPRTGTHWIKNVVENSCNIHTYELFWDMPPKYIKEIIMVKIHARNRFHARLKAFAILPPHSFQGNYIYTYRDPRDAIISLYEMYKKKKQIPNMHIRDFLETYDPIRQYKWEIHAWVLPRHDNVLLVRYESIKASPETEFKRIFDYLGLDTKVDMKIVGQMVSSEKTTKRKRGISYGWKNGFNEYGYLIKEVSTKLYKEIEKLGYESL